MQFERRAYQEEGLASIQAAFREGYRRVGYTLPTGGGKSFVFSRAAEAAVKKGKRVGILAHRQEICDQVSKTLDEIGIDHGMIMAGRTGNSSPVQIASVMTLARRLGKYPPFDLIVTDECHHAVSPTYQKIMAAHPSAYSLGVSATFERLDGRGFDDCFDKLIVGPSIRELTDQGYLCPSLVYAPASKVDLSGVHTRMGDYAVEEIESIMTKSVLTGAAVDHYQRLCPGQPAVAFCVSVKHSEQVAAQFRAAGIRAEHVDGTTDPIQRRRLIAALGAGQLDVLTNCGIISEGVDVPRIAAVILLRPTQSLSLWLQMVGRGLRRYGGNTRALVLDHANCTATFGLPDDPREWSLEGRKRGRKKSDQQDDGPSTKQCSDCFAMCLSTAANCPACGKPFRVVGRPGPEQVDGELVEFRRDPEADRLKAMTYKESLAWAGTDIEKLYKIAKAKKYRRTWAMHVLRGQRRAG
jgi:superfamily II DNA or RNA helicase